MSNTHVETVNTGADKFKLGLAILIVIAGIFAYSYFDDLDTLSRVGIFVGSLIVALLLAWFSHAGKRFVGFAIASYHELKRVTWPTRKETIQMTGIVFAFVIVMAVFLWVADRLLQWIVNGVILGWS